MAINRRGGILLFKDGASGHDLANNNIHHNVIRMREGAYNGITTTNIVDPAVYSNSKNNRFRGNSYFVARLRNRYWYWAGALKTWSQWRTAGQDTRGNDSPAVTRLAVEMTGGVMGASPAQIHGNGDLVRTAIATTSTAAGRVT